jgi:transcriptional regulator with XRE-family HTH domain
MTKKTQTRHRGRLSDSPVARVRYAAGYENTQEPATALDCSQAYLWAIEQGRAQPGEDLERRMAELYRVDQPALAKAIRTARRALLHRQIKDA